MPVNNFEQIPVFDSDPYDYGTPVAVPAAASRRRREPDDGLRRAKSCRSG